MACQTYAVAFAQDTTKEYAIVDDAEIQAISAVAAALRDLDDATRVRVLRWAADRYATPAAPIAPPSMQPIPVAQAPHAHQEPEIEDADVLGEDGSMGDDDAPAGSPTYKDFADLFEAASPTQAEERALVAGYWLHKVQGLDGFQSFAVNKELKQLGHGDTHINRSFTRLIGQKPALVLQTKRSSKSQQGRKTYRLTAAGVKEVERMLANGA